MLRSVAEADQIVESCRCAPWVCVRLKPFERRLPPDRIREHTKTL